MKLRLSPLRAFVCALATCLTVVPGALAASNSWSGAKTNLQAACKNQEMVQPFEEFGDPGNYYFAPNGGFESSTKGNWLLTGSATVVNGNEPYYVHAEEDKKSLSLPAGATATTPALCLGALHPWSRLFVNGPVGGALKVDLLYVDALGVPGTAPVAVLTGLGSWQLSSQLMAPSFLLAPFSALGYTGDDGQRYSAIAYRFTASAGTWQLDDLYVDPFKFG